MPVHGSTGLKYMVNLQEDEKVKNFQFSPEYGY